MTTAVHRRRVLDALGLAPWQRRAQPTPNVASQRDPAGAACVVVLPAECAPRALDLLGRALVAFGATLARAGRVRVESGRIAGDVPSAAAYLVLGRAQAHALGRALSAEQMRRAQIVLADDPGELLADPAAKRRLWNAMRQLRPTPVAAG